MKTRRRQRILACCILIGLWIAPWGWAQDVGFKLVVHAENPTPQIDSSTVARMFIKKLKRWEDDVEVLPVDQERTSDVRQAFSQAVHGKSVNAIKSYWQRMIFSGRNVPPEEYATDALVIEFVSKNRGGIGYVDSTTELPAGVKELKVIE